MSAGPPRFATGMPRQMPRISVPVATRQAAYAQPAAAAPAADLENPYGLEQEEGYGFVYLLRRTMAYTVDSCLNIALCIGALSGSLWKQDLSPELLLNPGIILVALLFLCVFNWALVTAQEVAFGTSIGKRLFGLVLHGSTSAVFLRAFFFLPSAGFLGMGLLWALIDSRRRCWHDMVVNVQPQEIARL